MKSFILGLIFVLAAVLLPAQVTNAPAADTNVVAASQAPDDVTKKLSDLIHAGKYTEAQQLIPGLLLAYPDDQRLIKGKTLLDKLLATAKPADIVTGNSQPTNSVAQPTTEQLIGMDKVEYNSLIELGKEAQQTTDLDQQKSLLKQFMDDSSQFLQKHPDQMLLWQFRIVAAISLNDPMAGYEAGQKLLSAGAADSNDRSLQGLLGQLKNKGWLDKQKAHAEQKREDLKRKFSWLVGIWNVTESWNYSSFWSQNLNCSANSYTEEFSITGATINGFVTDASGTVNDLRGTILDSGEISWECYLPNPGHRRSLVLYDDGSPRPFNEGHWSGGWQPALSIEINRDSGTMKISSPSIFWPAANIKSRQYPITYVFTKGGVTQNALGQPQQLPSK